MNNITISLIKIVLCVCLLWYLFFILTGISPSLYESVNQEFGHIIGYAIGYIISPILMIISSSYYLNVVFTAAHTIRIPLYAGFFQLVIMPVTITYILYKISQ